MGNKITKLLIFIIIGMIEFVPFVYSYAEETDQKLPETYIIKKGDTLWDISEKFLKNPFRWPDVWQKNDYINNPDLIYPGNELLLRKIFPPQFFEQKEKEAVKEPVKVKAKRKVTVTRKKRIAKPVIPPIPEKVPVTDFFTFRSAGFIVKKDINFGNIIGSKWDHAILSNGDIVYIDISPDKNNTIGKKFTIYRLLKKIKHPVTKKNMGNLIKVVGALEIREFHENNSSALIIESYEDVQEGDLLTDYINLEIPMIDPFMKPTEKDIQGYIIEVKDGKTSVGWGEIVYLDIGRTNGVAPGDTFIAYRTKDKKSGFFFKKVAIQYPETIIGELKIISSRDETSTALVTKSIIELGIAEEIKYKVTEKEK